MNFRGVQEHVLGGKGKPKVLMHLLSGAAPGSEREIARQLGMSNVAVNKIMKDFEEAGLVAAEKAGQAKVWRVNQRSFAYEKLKALAALAEPAEDLKEFARSRLLGWKESIEFAAVHGAVVEGKSGKGEIGVTVVLKHGTVAGVGEEQARKRVEEILAGMGKEAEARYGNAVLAVVMTKKEAEAAGSALEKARRGAYVLP
ncbi:MAG: winged helix-turn-helix domain-containing protein [Candidatus Micrarchaeia archaeon]|jgi:predicted ArsR family transcriptional regulator